MTRRAAIAILCLAACVAEDPVEAIVLDPPEIAGRALQRELILGGALGYTHAYRYRGTADGLELVQTFAAERAGAIFDGAVLAQDFDRDGHDDLAVLPRGDAAPISLFLGRPDGSLAETPALGPDIGASARPAGDLDGDGRIDLQVSGPTFVLVRDDPTAWVSNTVSRVSEFYSPAGDLDADGYADVLAWIPCIDNCSGGAYWFHGSPDGLQPNPAVGRGPLTPMHMVPIGDVNGDGYGDAADDTHYALGGAGTLTPHPTPTYASGDRTRRTAVGIGDVDDDGYGDVAFARAGSVLISRGGPDGLGDRPWILQRPEPAFGATVAPVGDLDADGHDDIVVFEAAGTHLRGDRAYLYFGGPTGPAAVLVMPRPSDGLLSPSATSRAP